MRVESILSWFLFIDRNGCVYCANDLEGFELAYIIWFSRPILIADQKYKFIDFSKYGMAKNDKSAPRPINLFKSHLQLEISLQK